MATSYSDAEIAEGTTAIAVSVGSDADNAPAPQEAEVMADTMAIAVSAGADADNAPPAQEAPAAPPAFVPDAVYTTFFRGLVPRGQVFPPQRPCVLQAGR